MNFCLLIQVPESELLSYEQKISGEEYVNYFCSYKRSFTI